MRKKRPPEDHILQDKFVLQLYVSGMSPKSLEAIKNINQFCDEFLKDAFELEIIDIYKNPELVAEQSIIFSPCLIKQLPLPKKILIGTLKDREKVIRALGIISNKPE
jgi:circadian clock protein KaiB